MKGSAVDIKANLRYMGNKEAFAKALLAIDTVPLPHYAKIDVIPLPDSETTYKTQVFTVQIGGKEIPLTELTTFLAKVEMIAMELKERGWIIDTCPPWPRPWPGPMPKPEQGMSTWMMTIKQV